MRKTARHALAIVGIVGVSAFANAGVALASPPTAMHFGGSFTEVDDQTCSFEVVEHQEFNADVRFFYDESGDLDHSINHIEANGTFTANGTTLVGRTSVVHTYDFTSGVNGDLGLSELIRSPNGGAILIDAGRVVYEDDGTMLFDAGVHPRRGDVAAFCAALTG